MAVPAKTPITQIAIGSAVDPTTANAPHADLEQNIDDILAFLTNAPASYFDNNDATTTGLTFGYFGGLINEGLGYSIVADGTVGLSATSTNTVYLYNNGAGYFIANTAATPPAGAIPLWEVTTDAVGITGMVDLRTPLRDHWTSVSGELSFLGAIGVGIANPSATVHVYSATDDVLKLATASVSGNPKISFIQDTTERATIYYQDFQDTLFITSFSQLEIRTNFATAVTIDASQNMVVKGTLSTSLSTQHIKAGGRLYEKGTREVVPVGHILIMPLHNTPAGYLECDGSLVSITVYAELFAIIGYTYGGTGATFALPDYRGMHLRGWDHGAGVDPDALTRTDRGDGTTGDQPGTRQADELKSHTHTAYHGNNVAGSYSDGFGYTDTHQTGATGGNETRPKNVNVVFYIKY